MDIDLSTLIDILVANPDRKEIWRFLYNASPVWSKKLLHRIKESALENNFPADEKLILTRLFDLNQKFNLEEFKDSIFLYLNQIKSSSFIMHKSIYSLAIFRDGKTILIGTKQGVIVWNSSKQQQLKEINFTRDFEQHKINIACDFEQKDVAFDLSPQYRHEQCFIIYKAEIKTRAHHSRYNYNHQIDESIYTSKLLSIEPSRSTSDNRFSLCFQDKFRDSGARDDKPTYWINKDTTETFDLTMAVSSNGNFLAVGGIANSYERKCFKPFVKVWSLSHGLILNEFSHFNIVSLVFSQDSKVLASGSKDGSINLINEHLADDISVDDMRSIALDLKGKIKSGVIVLATVSSSKPLLVAAVSAEANKLGIKAGELIKTGSAILGGGGGGKDDFAQGGGVDAKSIDKALSEIANLITGKIN